MNLTEVTFVPPGFEERYENEFPTVKRVDLMVKALCDDEPAGLFELSDDLFEAMRLILIEMGLPYKVVVGIPDLPSPLSFNNELKDNILSMHNLVIKKEESPQINKEFEALIGDIEKSDSEGSDLEQSEEEGI